MVVSADFFLESSVEEIDGSFCEVVGFGWFPIAGAPEGRFVVLEWRQIGVKT